MWYTVLFQCKNIFKYIYVYTYNIYFIIFSLVKLFTNLIKETPDHISLLITRYNIPNTNFIGHNTH